MQGTQTGSAANPSNKDARHGDHLLSRDDIEDQYRLTRRWLELAALRGDGPPFVKISSRLVRYRRSDFESWLAKHERTNTCAR